MPLSDQQIAEILSVYGRHGSLRAAAEATGYNVKTVTTYVKAAGLPIGPAHGRGGRADGRTHFDQPPVSEQERRRMAAMAAEGFSQKQIADALGRGETTVRRHLRRMGIEPMDPATRARRYPLDERAFARPSPQRDYFASFVAADGNVFGSKLTVVQMASERAHLERLLAFLQTERPLHERPGTRSVAAVVYSRPLVADLAALGITERKSATLRLADTLAASPACWLGLLDGDGWVTAAGADGIPRISWSGSRHVMDQCASFWEPILGHRYAVYRPNQGDLWALTLTGATARRAAPVLLASVSYSMPRTRRALEAMAGV